MSNANHLRISALNPVADLIASLAAVTAAMSTRALTFSLQTDGVILDGPQAEWARLLVTLRAMDVWLVSIDSDAAVAADPATGNAFIVAREAAIAQVREMIAAVGHLTGTDDAERLGIDMSIPYPDVGPGPSVEMDLGTEMRDAWQEPADVTDVRDAICALLDDRDFLGYQLSHAKGTLDDEQFKEIADKYLTHVEMDDAALMRKIRALIDLIGDRADSDVIATALRVDIAQVWRVTAALSGETETR